MKAVHLLLSLCFLFCSHPIFGQTNAGRSSFGYSIPKQRLQFELTTSFVYFVMLRRLDMDSAAILVSEGEHLPHSLYYDRDFIDGPDNQIKSLLRQGSYYLFKAGADKKDLDAALPFFLSAKAEADKTRDVYWRNAALTLLAKYYLQSNEPAKSKDYFTQAVNLARRSNNPVILARALANRGTAAGFDDPQKEADFNESLKLVRQQRDTVSEIKMLTGIYEVHFVQQKFDTVKKQLLHVTELEKLIGFKHTHYNHYVLSYLNFFVGDMTDGFTECKEAIAIMEANQDFAFSSFFYGNMGYQYLRFENYEKAMEWLNKSIQREPVNVAKRIWYADFYFIAIGISTFGEPQLALQLVQKTIAAYPPESMVEKMHVAHVLGKIHHQLGKLDLAGKYYDEMLPYLDSLQEDRGEKEVLFYAYGNLTLYHIKVGNIKLAKQYFEKSKSFMDITRPFNVNKMHLMQYKIDSSEGNYLNALNEFHIMQEQDDSMYNVIKARQFVELQIQYQTESKDKDIELLKQKDKTQQAILERSDLMKNITLAGILVMILITALVYIQYRNKQKSNIAINEKNKMLEQLVKDKEWLVKEIHHRVKNNFHVVASLLEIQSSYLKNKAALSAIKDSQHRIHSMSIIHQKLYQSETLSTIHMPEYIYELVEYLRESYGIRGNIRFELHVEKIELNHASAITLGLILNEAITNSIKYAFGHTAEGKISISLAHISDTEIMLSVSDNGRGLPADFNDRIGASMGMELLQGLTDDIGGTFNIQTDEGTHINIIFPLKGE
ncbi:histidine kinase dimerization/phosphoacceptor domain -containing protein [Chitinophaga niabensis]|uniref:histidine kinase n=1 Tax=Chitinophaga niabensis TaxID=536979 RepID=A0A1N6F7Y6_9BACT|nr:histidine kinase dimerization/phosphoacceptor domain -containing protein [Chitinophaga niabensis]SIN91408.1 Two-component sensor histidine kinase, contains HisKA and HATPase domains [Chitinophaga niabensis]